MQDDGEHGKASEFHEHRPIAVLHGCKASFLIRSSAMWDSVVVDIVFCTSSYGSFDRIVVCREGKSISRLSGYFNKNKVLAHP